MHIHLHMYIYIHTHKCVCVLNIAKEIRTLKHFFLVAKEIRALKQCHEEKSFQKWFGGCNQAKIDMDQCFFVSCPTFPSHFILTLSSFLHLIRYFLPFCLHLNVNPFSSFISLWSVRPSVRPYAFVLINHASSLGRL